MSKKTGRAARSALSKQLVLQYFLSIIGFVAGFFLLFFLAWQLCSQFTWYDGDPLYTLLKVLQDTALIWGGIVLIVGVIIITHRFISKPLSYLDEVVAASEKLVSGDENPIVLPQAIKNVEDELNLVRAQAMKDAAAAKEAEQRKNDLVVYLAHDLKTPLTSVIGYLSLLNDEPQISVETRARYTGIALDKAQRLEELINEFFDITRFSLTHLTIEKETVDLTRMLEQISFEFNPVLNEKDLRWEQKLQPEVSISCDPDKLERVFDNLIRNAVNYSYPGTKIEITLTSDDNSAVVTVKNHGKTIPPEKLDRIFEQFFRLDSSRGSATGGSGLGLAIAKEIVELHCGTIRAESADESIAFTVTLPLGVVRKTLDFQ